MENPGLIDSIVRPRPAPPWLLLLTLAGVIGCNAILNQWFVPSRIWEPIYYATGGLVYPALLGGMFSITLQVVIVLILISRLRPREVGLDASKLPTAFLYTLVVWGAVQLLAVALSAVASSVPRIAGAWSAGGASYEIGKLFGQLCGNALAEEIVFRGFLLGQCLVFCRHRITDRWLASTVVAVLAGSLLFALSHVPNRLMKDVYASAGPVLLDQAKLLVMGSFFCWLYLRTRNLFFVVGTHALMNRPTVLFAMSERIAPEAACVVVTALVALLWRQPTEAGNAPTIP